MDFFPADGFPKVRSAESNVMRFDSKFTLSLYIIITFKMYQVCDMNGMGSADAATVISMQCTSIK